MHSTKQTNERTVINPFLFVTLEIIIDDVSNFKIKENIHLIHQYNNDGLWENRAISSHLQRRYLRYFRPKVCTSLACIAIFLTLVDSPDQFALFGLFNHYPVCTSVDSFFLSLSVPPPLHFMLLYFKCYWHAHIGQRAVVQFIVTLFSSSGFNTETLYTQNLISSFSCFDSFLCSPHTHNFFRPTTTLGRHCVNILLCILCFYFITYTSVFRLSTM